MWTRLRAAHARGAGWAFASLVLAALAATTTVGCAQSDTGGASTGAGATGGFAGAGAGAASGGASGGGASGGGASGGGTAGTGGVAASGGGGGIDSGAGGARPDGSAGPCTPGAERACACIGLDGLPATQRCLGDGSGWIPCACRTQVCVPGTTITCNGGTQTCLPDGAGYGQCSSSAIQCPGGVTCAGGALGSPLPACCLPGGVCGLDPTPAHSLVAAIPTTCTAVAQPGPTDATCATRTLVFPAGSKDLGGCCRPDHTCGVIASFGSAEFGCVDPVAWGFPAGAGCGPAARCVDHVKDGTETDVDCGGPDCVHCASGLHCSIDGDCTTGFCSLGACAVPDCNDGVKNGTETGTDCGGGCARPCPPTFGCKIASDCSSSVCVSLACQAPTCTDRVENGGETGVDCGGPCPACAPVADGGRP